MFTSRFLFPLVALAPLALPAQDAASWQPVPYAEKAAHAPRPLPDRVVLTWSGDPATTQSVTWRTDTSILRSIAELSLAGDSGRDLKPATVAARTERLTTDLGEAAYHSVTFTGLTPDTLYAYRVGDGVNWSEWFHFRTASREARPFTFVYFGDAQNDLKTHWSRVFRESFRDAPRAAFTLHAGDLINRANRDAEWGEWFGAPAWVNASVPVIAAPGNHEYFNDGTGPETERKWTAKDGRTLDVKVSVQTEKDAAGKTTRQQIRATAAGGGTGTITLGADGLVTGVDAAFTAPTGYTTADLAGQQPDKRPLRDRIGNPGTRRVSHHWRPQFAFPTQNAPVGLEEMCYYIDYQGTRIIALDSNRAQAEQVPWLRRVLSENRQRWTIVTMHHPIFSPANNRDNPELRAAWKPLFDEFKVDLVLTGHDHTYARSGDVAGKVGTVNVPAGYQQAYDPAIGTVYVVSVSGPKMYNITNDSFAVRTAEDTQLYQIIHVGLDELRYEARTATGRLYDAFTLHKRAGRANELIETLPTERRRPAATKKTPAEQ
jgi:3',5'-cyclic AMP phosphodiesterase CpdA